MLALYVPLVQMFSEWGCRGASLNRWHVAHKYIYIYIYIYVYIYIYITELLGAGALKEPGLLHGGPPPQPQADRTENKR